MELVIVESPAKARTISKILGSRYQVKASLGHVRDLPKKQLGVDVKNGFTPKYVVPKQKREIVRELKEIARKASAVYLATDPDREGEAISWHLIEAAELFSLPCHRVVFHEITEKAVKEAFSHPRVIDLHLVQAQQARRILDRLVGYKLSPLLWQKVQRGLSAGRVQSVAVRLIVDREQEIENFVPKEYWSIEAELAKISPAGGRGPSFKAKLIGSLDNKQKLDIPCQEKAQEIVAELQQAVYLVAKVNRREIPRHPVPPFITSTLQQEAFRKLHFTVQHTMAVAQRLYEGLSVGGEGVVGLITYMRTDSTRVAESAVAETRTFIGQKYGPGFLSPQPRLFTKKAKAAQEAHEAIRPTSVKREPELIRSYLTRDQARLYDLIWKRMVASQMAAAVMDSTTVDIKAENHQAGKTYLLRASASVVKHPGFLILYSEGKDEETDEEGGKYPLPPLTKNERLLLLDLFSKQHFTQPPPRYTEATLVKALEEKGIGRPSTYAPILATIQQRHYVEKKNGQFYPSELGRIVNSLLIQHFSNIVDIGFTARMEEELDEIARGQQGWVPVLQEFYAPFEQALHNAGIEISKVQVIQRADNEFCPQCGKPMMVKMGRYGKFLACSDYPQCRGTKPLLVKVGAKCPECGGELVERVNKRKHRFYGCASFPKCQFTVGQRPLPQPCPSCGGLLLAANRSKTKCIKCDYRGTLEKPDAVIGVVNNENSGYTWPQP